jgi:hypothetical protein
MGAWVANLLQNWDTAGELRALKALVTAVACGGFLIMQMFEYHSGKDGSSSYVAHIAGFVGGLTYGTYVLKNTTQLQHEVYIRWFGIGVFGCGLFTAAAWNNLFNYDRRGFCEEDTLAKCNLTKSYYKYT